MNIRGFINSTMIGHFTVLKTAFLCQSVCNLRKSVKKNIEIPSNLKNHSCIRGNALFKHPTMHLIRFSKIQIGTRMTRMLCSADLLLKFGRFVKSEKICRKRF